MKILPLIHSVSFSLEQHHLDQNHWHHVVGNLFSSKGIQDSRRRIQPELALVVTVILIAESAGKSFNQ